MRFTRIGCAVAPAEHARLALAEAAELAALSGATLVLLHVNPPTLEVGPWRNGSAWQEAPLASWRREAEHVVGHPVPAHQLAGASAGACIVAWCWDQGLDLLVVGTRQRADLPGAVFGSVAEHVVRNAPCPVLVVKPCGTAAPRARPVPDEVWSVAGPGATLGATAAAGAEAG